MWKTLALIIALSTVPSWGCAEYIDAEGNPSDGGEEFAAAVPDRRAMEARAQVREQFRLQVVEALRGLHLLTTPTELHAIYLAPFRNLTDPQHPQTDQLLQYWGALFAEGGLAAPQFHHLFHEDHSNEHRKITFGIEVNHHHKGIATLSIEEMTLFFEYYPCTLIHPEEALLSRRLRLHIYEKVKPVIKKYNRHQAQMVEWVPNAETDYSKALRKLEFGPGHSGPKRLGSPPVNHTLFVYPQSPIAEPRLLSRPIPTTQKPRESEELVGAGVGDSDEFSADFR